MRKLEKALDFLNSLIADGWEFPDAHSKAASKFKVNSDQLTELYDTQF